MNANRIIFKMLLFLLAGCTLACVVPVSVKHPVPPSPVDPIQPPVIITPTATPWVEEIEPIAVFPLPAIQPTVAVQTPAVVQPTDIPAGHRVVNTTLFTTTLYSGEVYKFVLGPCATDGGYLVDVTPLEESANGAHIEQQVLPEFDGEMWVDVLSLLLPEPAAPLPVRVELASTVGWPIAFQQTVTVNPGDWSGFIIQESEIAAGYVIEINPRSAGGFGDRVEKALVQPEFSSYRWWDVLRLQIPSSQPALTAELVVYQTPADAQVVTTYVLEAEPGVWYGVALGGSWDRAVYIVEVTPLIYADSAVERFTVQPEFDGHTWNDVVRVSIPSDHPPTALQVIVYRVALGEG